MRLRNEHRVRGWNGIIHWVDGGVRFNEGLPFTTTNACWFCTSEPAPAGLLVLASSENVTCMECIATEGSDA